MGAPENPPAFPLPYANDGMSLRDWFAGQALNGIMSAEAPDVIYSAESAAARAYGFADAMLAARQPAADPEFDEVYASCGHSVGAADCDTWMPF